MDKEESVSENPNLTNEAPDARWPRFAAIALGAYVFLGGLISFLGWAADLPSLTDWEGRGISIQPNTTVVVMAAGAAIILLNFHRQRVSTILGALVGLIGLSSILQIALHYDFGINRFLMFGREWGRVGVIFPGLMGTPGAVCWTMLGAALLLLSFFPLRSLQKRSSDLRFTAAVLAMISMSVSSLSMIGYLYGAEALYTLPKLTVIALQTATFIFAVSLGTVLSITDRGPTRLFGGTGPESILARKVIPAIIALPIVIGAVRLAGERAGYYDLAFGSAIRTVVEIALLLALCWWAGSAISRFARQAEQNRRALTQLADAMPQVVWMSDDSGKVEYYNARADGFAGIVREPDGKFDWKPGLHPDDLPATTAAWKEAVQKMRTYVQEHRIRMADGTFRWHLSRAIPAAGSNGDEPKWFGTATDIHDLKIAESALRESEYRFARFMQNLPGLAWIKDRDGRYVYANETAQKAFGKAAGELYGKTDHEIFPPETAAGFIENDRKALETPAGRQTIEALKDASGAVRYSLVNKFPIPVNDGATLIGGIAIDITEQKTAQDNQEFLFRISEKIRVSRNAEDLLAEIAEEVGVFLDLHRCLFNEIDVDLDTETVHRDYSRTGESVAGKHKISDYSTVNSEDMAQRMTVVNRDSQNDPRTAEYFEKTYGPNKELAYVAVPMMRDGKWAASLWCSDDRPRNWTNHEITLIENVAERAWAAVERLRSEVIASKLAAIVRSSDDAIISKDLNGIIVSWNRGAEIVFGYTEQEVVGKPVTILIPEERLDEEPEILRRLRRGESVDHYETVRRRKDGRLLDISLTVSPIFDAEGKIVGASKVARDITERSQREKALRETEARSKLAQEAGNVGIWDWDVETGKLYWSETMWEFYGGNPDGREPDNVLWAAHLHPDDRDRVVENMQGIMISEALEYRDEYRILNPDGNVRWIEARATIVRGEAGAARRMYGVNLDVTEKKLIEQRIRASEKQLRLATDAIPALVSYVDHKERYRFVNRQYTDWFGKPREHFIGKKMRGVLGARAYSVVRPYVEQVLAGHELSFDSWLNYREIGQRFVHVAYVPDVGLDGNVVGFYGLVSDLTDLKRSEDLLRASEERIRLMTESFTDFAILSTDIDGRIDSWNPGAAKIFGFSDSEVIGQFGDILFTPEDVAKGAPIAEMRTARRDGRASDERWHMRKDGSRFFASGVMVPLYVGRVLTGYAKIATDLTERKKNAEALQRAHDEMEMRVLERTRELAETNTTLVAEINERKAAEEQTISLLKRLVTTQEDERRRIARDLHDQLGQRLTALRLKIASLREFVSQDEELTSRTNRLQEIAELLDSEVSFLAWELRPSAIEELGLVDAIGTFVREWSRHYGIAAEFHATGMGGIELVQEADTHLYRIAQEALNNIVKHAAAKKVNILVEQTGGQIVLIVEDDGKGFTRDAAKPRKSPRGLGLTGMEERASLIGGHVEIESSPGRGTTIFARVPLTSGAKGKQNDRKT